MSESNVSPTESVGVTKIEAVIRRAAGLVTNVLNMVLPIASLIGGVVLIAYLRHSGAGLPPIDGSTALFLLFLTVTFTVMFGVLVLMLLLPGTSKLVASKNTRELFPSLFVANSGSRGWCCRYTKDYLSFYLPFLVFTMLIVMHLIVPDIYLSALVPFLIFLAIGAIVGPFFIFQMRIGTIAGAQDYFLSSLIASFFSLIPFVIFTSLLIEIAPDSVLKLEGIQALALIALLAAAIVGLHWVMNILPFTPRQLFAISGILFICVVFGWPGPSYVGGIALRYLGSGGHLPVSLMVKSLKSDDVAEPVTGCLVLNTSTQIILRPTMVKDNCRLLPPALEENDYPEPFSGVVNYGAGEIITISSWP